MMHPERSYKISKSAWTQKFREDHSFLTCPMGARKTTEQVHSLMKLEKCKNNILTHYAPRTTTLNPGCPPLCLSLIMALIILVTDKLAHKLDKSCHMLSPQCTLPSPSHPL